MSLEAALRGAVGEGEDEEKVRLLAHILLATHGAVENYDPEQPRDEGGRWGGGIKNPDHEYVRQVMGTASKLSHDYPNGFGYGRDRIDDYYKSIGHSADTIQAFHSALNDWSGDKRSQEAAGEALVSAVRDNSPLGKLVLDHAALETAAHKAWAATQPARAEASAKRAGANFDDDYPSAERYDRGMYQGAHAEHRKDAEDTARDGAMDSLHLRRKGSLSGQIQSWSSNEGGANMAPVTRGEAGAIGADHKEKFEDLEKRGWKILAGGARSSGQSGEGEVTLINLGRIVGNYDPDQPRDDSGRWGSGIGNVMGTIRGVLRGAKERILAALDAVPGGGAAVAGAGLRSGNPLAVAKGVARMVNAVFHCVHTEVFENALAQHSIPGAAMVAKTMSTVAAKVHGAVAGLFNEDGALLEVGVDEALRALRHVYAVHDVDRPLPSRDELRHRLREIVNNANDCHDEHGKFCTKEGIGLVKALKAKGLDLPETVLEKVAGINPEGVHGKTFTVPHGLTGIYRSELLRHVPSYMKVVDQKAPMRARFRLRANGVTVATHELAAHIEAEVASVHFMLPDVESRMSKTPISVGFKGRGSYSWMQGRSACGMADYTAGKITLAGGLDKEDSPPQLGVDFVCSDARGVFRHEYGHMVHLKGLDGAERAEWHGVWRGSVRGSKAVSGYAAQDHYEGFAESFSVFSSKHYEGDLPKPVHDFMTKTFKMGKSTENAERDDYEDDPPDVFVDPPFDRPLVRNANDCHAAGTGKFCGATVGKAEHLHSAQLESEVADAVGGVVVPRERGKQLDRDVDVGNHGLEVKGFYKGERHEVKIHEDALLRKAVARAATGRVFHTVAIDERENYEGGQHSENYSGHRLYYKRGAKRVSLSSMHPVESVEELKKLIAMADHELPEKAKGVQPTVTKELREKAEKAHASRLAKDTARRKRATENVGNPCHDEKGQFCGSSDELQQQIWKGGLKPKAMQKLMTAYIAARERERSASAKTPAPTPPAPTPPASTPPPAALHARVKDAIQALEKRLRTDAPADEIAKEVGGKPEHVRAVLAELYKRGEVHATNWPGSADRIPKSLKDSSPTHEEAGLPVERGRQDVLSYFFVRNAEMVSVEFSGAPDGDDGPFALANTDSWVAVCHWAEGLPKEFPQIKALCAGGRAEDTHALAKELQILQVVHGGPPADAREVIADLRRYVGVGDKQESAEIT